RKEDPVKIEGALKAEDPKDPVHAKGPHKVREVKMTEGKTYIINLRSNKFDSFLRLENADGKQLAEDDDSGGFPNAKLVFTAPKTGNYRLIVTCDDGKVGEYTLTVEAGTAAFGKLGEIQAALTQEVKPLEADFKAAATDADRKKVVDRFFELQAK